MNIEHQPALRPCTSCGVCAAVCPTGAIEFRLDTRGFYRPHVVAEKCIDCGLCVKSCYKFDPEISQDSTDSKQLFAARATDRALLKQTTSGGIADLLAKHLISKGYKCIGVTYDSTANRAVNIVASSAEQTDAFRGSKYIQTYTVDAFRQLVSEAKTEKYAVFGLPCHTYALDRYLTARNCRGQHVLIDLFCHGCPSMNVWQKYVAELLQKVGSQKVISANFRSKKRGWGSFYVVVVVVEGREQPIEKVSPRAGDEFFELFFSNLVLNDSCADCKLRSSLDYADIRLGDFWGPEYVTDSHGMSAVAVNTAKGAEIWAELAPHTEHCRQDFAKFLPYQSFGKIYRINPAVRDQMLASLGQKSTKLKEAVAIYHNSQSLSKKVLRMAKNAVALLPAPYIRIIKKLSYRF